MQSVDQKLLEKIYLFFRAYPENTYKKGDVILRASDPPYGVYYLVDGFVRQYIISPSGELFIVHIYKPGSFFPLTWVLNDTPNIFHYDAMVNSIIRRAPKAPFIAFLQQHSDVLFYATQKLAAGMQGLVTRVSQLVLDDAYTKTLLLLLYYGQNFGQTDGPETILKVPLTHREVASWIGTTRETASLQIEELKKRGIISTRGRTIIIHNMQKLFTETRSS